MNKCPWCLTTPLYEKYHDEEWGTIQTNPQKLFEALSLEMFQSGLSWLTILNKREGFRAAFHYFDIEKVSQMNEVDVERLLQDEGMVRHRKKIESCILNAKAIIAFGGIDFWAKWIWSYSDYQSILRAKDSTSISQNELSKKLSKDLKAKGFKFLGPTTVYSFMQSIGMQYDHEPNCYRYQEHKDVKKDPKLKEWSKS